MSGTAPKVVGPVTAGAGALGAAGRPDPQALAELACRYSLEVDPASIPRLLEEHDLRFEPFSGR